MEWKEIMHHVDHTLLTQTATWTEIQKLCEEGLKYETASVCIPSCFVKPASDFLKGRLAVCTVVGFPNGYQPAEIKLAETKKALSDGADEIDMVIHIGDVKERNYDKICDEIRQLKEACGSKILKVIIETCLLTTEEKVELCRVVSESGADFIKTSTGFSTAGATFDDVKLFRENVDEHVKIKAAGGISSFDDAREFLRLGADRLGTSRLVKILEAGVGDHPFGQKVPSQKPESQDEISLLIKKAIEARSHSYSPYSHFQVGACLQTKDGSFYTGCNIENASYSATNCAERTAFFKAVSEQNTAFQRIAIVGGRENGNLEWCPPCGICRQVMQEFCDSDTFEIVLAVSEKEYKVFLLKDLLPFAFSL